MAKRILVPLDHGTECELVLPLIGDLARGSGAIVRLLHVAPRPENAVTPKGRLVTYSDQEMTREIDAFEADLVVVTTTCRNGVKRALLGSVASR
jgi:nucleotide-binding universal stress UspA family protein